MLQNEKIQPSVESFASESVDSFAGLFSASSTVRSGKVIQNNTGMTQNATATAPTNLSDPAPSDSKTVSSFSDLTLPDRKNHEDQNKNPSGNEDLSYVSYIPTKSLNEMLGALSDGLFEQGVLTTFDDIDALTTACRQAIHDCRHSPLADRRDLAHVINRAMNVMTDAGFQWPRGLLPVLKKLREGGPIQNPISKPPYFRREYVLYDSVLSKFQELLEPYYDWIQKVADTNSDGSPQTAEAGMDFLSEVTECMQNENEPVPEVFERVQEELRKQLPPKLAPKSTLHQQ